MEPTILDYITVIISTAAFVISLTTIFINRRKLTVDFPELLVPLARGSVYFFDDNGKKLFYEDGLFVSLEILNSSPRDISYFDLRAFDTKTNVNTFLLTRIAMLHPYSDKQIYRSNPNNPLSPYHLTIPAANNGVLKANSFNRFDLFIMPSPETEELALSFKVSIRAKPFCKDPYAVTKRKKFRYYGCKYPLENWKDMVIQPSDLSDEESARNDSAQ